MNDNHFSLDRVEHRLDLPSVLGGWLLWGLGLRHGIPRMSVVEQTHGREVLACTSSAANQSAMGTHTMW